MAAGIDKRQHPRFGVQLPVKIRFGEQTSPTPVSKERIHETVTNDISTGGIYFTLSEGCQLGSQLECILFLPPTSPSGQPVRVRFRAKVVRVEKPDSSARIGVAATIENYTLEKFSGAKAK